MPRSWFLVFDLEDGRSTFLEDSRKKKPPKQPRQKTKTKPFFCSSVIYIMLKAEHCVRSIQHSK